jgi:hypothetical protein
MDCKNKVWALCVQKKWRFERELYFGRLLPVQPDSCLRRNDAPYDHHHNALRVLPGQQAGT